MGNSSRVKDKFWQQRVAPLIIFDDRQPKNRCEVWQSLIVLSRSDSGGSAEAQVASIMNFPRLGDSFLASKSFFFSGLAAVISRIFLTIRSFTLLIRLALKRQLKVN